MEGAAMNWEYKWLAVQTFGAVEKEVIELNALGSVGWEVCGFGVHKVRGAPDVFHVLLKRPRAVAFPAPSGNAPAWHADPAGRFEQRYWDGLRWTEHVTIEGANDVDPPVAG
jgi:hypothetical protein